MLVGANAAAPCALVPLLSRYLTNTGVKAVLVLDDASAKDDAVGRVRGNQQCRGRGVGARATSRSHSPTQAGALRRHVQVLRRIHHAYVESASNPFFTFGAPVTCAKFDQAVEAAVAAFGK